MKSVLISIRPKWVEKIANGQKTIEVRKTAPQEVPFKCYIYESRNGGHRCKHCNKKDSCYSYAPKNVGCYNGRGRVIGEFVCDRVQQFVPLGMRGFEESKNTLKEMCTTNEELTAYGGLKPLYGWHISNLKIYDRPKELGEFKKTKEKIAMTCGMHARNGLCCAIDHEELCDNIKCCFKTPRPSQSWCYVEELEKCATIKD